MKTRTNLAKEDGTKNALLSPEFVKRIGFCLDTLYVIPIYRDKGRHLLGNVM